MEPFERDLLENLKGRNKSETGQVLIEVTNRYFIANETVPPPFPIMLNIVPIAPLAAISFFIDYPSVILCGYNDFISGYTTGFKYRDSITASELPGTIERGKFTNFNNHVLNSKSSASFGVVFLSGNSYNVNSTFFDDNTAKNGDIVLIQITNEFLPFGVGTNPFIGWVETLIKSNNIPYSSFVNLCDDEKTILNYLKIDFVDDLLGAPMNPQQQELALLIYKQNVFGSVHSDTITLQTFITADDKQVTTVDIPISAKLKGLGFYIAKTFQYDKLLFTFHIKIKN